MSTTTSPPDPTYTLKPKHPNMLPSATIYLGGLLCLAFDKTNNNMCTVGVNPAGGHKWKLQVREWGAKIDQLVRDQTSTPLDTKIEIKVTGGTTVAGNANGALVYTGPEVILTPDEHRYNLLDSWVDMEGVRGHNKPVALDSGILSPRFYIVDGLFCAYRLSTGRFILKDNRTPTAHEVPLGKVALAVAADIFLMEGGSIQIIHGGGTFNCLKNKQYQIYITNNCERPCDISSIDFLDHYTAFKGAFGGTGKYPDAEKFNLAYEDGSEEGDCKPIFPNEIGYGPLTDRAPCMKVTVGGTKTIN